MSFDRGSSPTDLRLCHSLCHQPGYNTFRSQLKKSLSTLDASTSPTTGDKNIDAALEVLRTEREEEEEDHEETDDDIGGSVTDQNENMVDETDRPQAPVDEVDNALKVLVRNATEDFGFAPRDVYDAVLDLPLARSDHADAVEKFDYSTLKALVGIFSGTSQPNDFSHRVIVVYPLENLPRKDDWRMDFKSIPIGREVMKRARLEEDRHLREIFDSLHGVPEGSTLAGWWFEAIAHRMFSNGWRSDGSPPQPILMAQDDRLPPAFSTDLNPLPLQPRFAPLRDYNRVDTPVDFKKKLSDLTLDGKNYYKPIKKNNPLFDSFTVDRDRTTAMISIFQMTISQNHGGSPKGYLHIQEIMDRVRELLKEVKEKVAVKVTYFLVCPESEFQHQWQMPNGWKKSLSGDVFCVCVPASAHHGLFTPNSAT